MSYENSEPKTLKTLNSDGQVLDDSGNVISDSTDYWKKLYNESEPKPDKILHSDGTIKDSAGNLIQGSTEFNVKKYNQAEPIPAKYLHADGTIDENPGSGGGGEGGSGSATAYAWKSISDDSFILHLSVDKAPDSSSDAKILYHSNDGYKVSELETYLEREGWEGTYTKVSDSQFQILWEGATEPDIFERVSEDDVIIWAGEGGGNATAYTWHGYFEDSTQHQEMDMGVLYFDFFSAPATQSDFMSGHTFDPDEYLKVVTNEGAFAWANITEYIVSEGVIHMTAESGNYRFVRDSSKDLSIWEAQGGGVTAYAWDSKYGPAYLNFNVAPSDMQEASTAMVKKRVYDFTPSPAGVYVKDEIVPFSYIAGADPITDYQKISDNSFIVEYDGDEITYTRVSSKDFTLWQLSE